MTVLSISKKPNSLDIPDIYYAVYQNIIAINHFKNEAYIFAQCFDDNASNINEILHLIKSRNFAEYEFSTDSDIESNLTDNDYKKQKVDYKDISKLLKKEVVAIFQSKSEQGQRGLGNRSLLLDINAPNAIKKMNSIKKREWFRPFACSILEEEASKWFDTKGTLSPYMMFVFKSKKPKLTKNVTCINNTSRIQTVGYTHNPHFHSLLKTHNYFYKTPLLLNTSLNLPGHTLVETMDDLLYLFENSGLKYIYLPEKSILISK